MIRSFLATAHVKFRRGDVHAKSWSWTTPTIGKFHFELNTFEREHDVARTPVGLDGKHVPGLFKGRVEEHLATFRNADAFQRFILIEFDGGSIVFPNVAVSKFCDDVHAGKGGFRCEKNVPPTGCWVVECDAIAGAFCGGMVFVSGRRRGLVKTHVQRGLASAVTQVNHQAFRSLRHLDLEVLRKAAVPTQQTVFHARC